MEADAAPLRHSADQRQQSFEFGRLGYAYRIAECEDLVSHTLECVAEPAAVDYKPPSDGISFGLISYQSYIHSFVSKYSVVISIFVMIVYSDE